MDLRRLRAGEWIAGVSGVVLFVSLFLPWYHVESVARDLTAFQVFTMFDVVLVMVAALGAALVLVTAIQSTAAVGIALDALVTIVAAVVAILLVFRVLNLPGDLETDAGADQATFAWVGLAATFGVFAGALVAMRDERLSKPGKPTDASGAPVDAPPEIEIISSP